MNTLVNIAEYTAKSNSTQSTALYLKALTFGLEHDNVPDKVVKIITTLSGLNKSTLDTVKNELIASLHLGFTRSTSESISITIVNIVRQQHWTRQFKNLLKDNDDKLSLFNKLAK